MKTYLLDASAFMFLIKKVEPQATARCLQESLILDLTYYEVGNAVWKESSLAKMITSNESEVLTARAQTILAKMEKIEGEADSFGGILDLAKKERLTFYDSSYIYFGKEKGLTLVTEDKELYTKAKKHINVQNTAEFSKA
jgi:predicted nucleic acid-binding protein